MVTRRGDEPRSAESRQSWVPRILAPLAFFAAATTLVLIVNSSLNADSGDEATPSNPATQPTTAEDGRGGEQTTTRRRGQRRFHRIREGDTLEALAERYNTTVDDLLALNPGINANALSPGQRVRVE